MNNVIQASSPDGDVETDAASWFARMRAGTMSAVETRALENWLAVPEHARAYGEVERMWQAVATLHDDPQLLRMREEARADGRTKRPWAYGAIAASILVAILLGLFITGTDYRAEEASPEAVRFATITGQRLPIALSDGSTIELDANSAVRVQFTDSRRKIEVEHGRAFFKVKRDTHRPFVVSAGGRSVTALGTAFSVDAAARKFDVVLAEGRVRVEGKSRAERRAIEMTAGSRLRIGADGNWRMDQIDPDKANAWLHGRLVFDNARLADVTAEIGRYTDQAITLAPDGTGDKRLSAVLQAGDTGTFLEAVKTLELARVGRDADGAILLHQK